MRTRGAAQFWRPRWGACVCLPRSPTGRISLHSSPPPSHPAPQPHSQPSHPPQPAHPAAASIRNRRIRRSSIRAGRRRSRKRIRLCLQNRPYQPQAQPFVPSQGPVPAPQGFVPQNTGRQVYPGPPYLGPNTPRPTYPGYRAPNNAPPGHLQSWLDQHRNVPVQDQEKMLRNDPSFNKLPQGQQQRLVRQLNDVNKMPDQQRERRLARAENLERLPAEDRMQDQSLGAGVDHAAAGPPGDDEERVPRSALGAARSAQHGARTRAATRASSRPRSAGFCRTCCAWSRTSRRGRRDSS